jgi:RHS repeat-associated protein
MCLLKYPVHRLIDADGVTQTFEYDPQGRLAQVKQSGDTTGYEYGTEADGLNGLLKAIDYPTYREEYKYDPRNRIVQTIQILAQPGTQNETTEKRISQTDYDAAGRIIALTDAQGRVTRTAYDQLNRVITITDPLNGVTEYRYDKQNNLLALTDAKGNTTAYAYNKVGALIKETRPLGETTQYTWDALNRLTTRTDAIGNETRYTYNVDGLPLTERYHAYQDGALSATPSQTVGYTYNARGELIAYSQTGDTESSATYEYDADGNRTGETITYGNGQDRFSKTLKESYTPAARKQTQTYPDGTIINYDYNVTGQLRKVALPDDQAITWESYRWQQPTKIVLPGVVKTFEYDPLQRPRRIKSQQIGAGTAETPTGDIIMDYRYQYDKAGNITQRQTEEGIYQYGYDTLDRLTQAIPPTPLQQNETNPNGLPIEGYGYDAVHNRIASQHQPGTWNYNQNNQLLQWGVENDKTSYTYNKLGHTEQETIIQNEIIAKQRSYYYNAAERLTEVKENGTSIAQYRYDPFGRRISKTVNGQTTYFQYSDEGLIAEYNQNGTIIKAYGWEPENMWGSKPIWQTDAGKIYYVHADHLGTSQILTDKDGKQIWTMQAEAFGNTTPKTDNTITNNLRFPGQYFDEETQTHYNYFRDYSPITGRYVESDPIGLNGGMNSYGYVNNPLVFLDPMGLFCIPLPSETTPWVEIWRSKPTRRFDGPKFSDITGALGSCKWSEDISIEEERKSRTRELCYECELLDCGEKNCAWKTKYGDWTREERRRTVTKQMTTGAMRTFAGRSITEGDNWLCNDPWTGRPVTGRMR